MVGSQVDDVVEKMETESWGCIIYETGATSRSKPDLAAPLTHHACRAIERSSSS